jgi:hypothetical protein
MATGRHFNLTDFIAFLLLVAAAAGVRVWYLSVAADNALDEGPIRVQDAQPYASGPDVSAPIRGHGSPSELDVLVNNLKERYQFKSRPPFGQMEQETAHVAPGYPFFLSLLERLGDDSARTDQVARRIQAGLGAFSVGLYYLIAIVAFRSRLVGLLTGLFCTFHPFWIANTATIDDGVLASFLLALCLFIGMRGAMVGGALPSLIYGLALAALALVRAALLPFAFAGLLWFLIRCRSLPRGWLCGLLAFLGFVNGLAPWSMRNWNQFHEVVPIVNSHHLHLWMGNNPNATGGPMTEAEMVQSMGGTTDDPDSKAWEIAHATRQKDRYGLLGVEALGQIKNNPGAFMRRRLWAGLCFFLGESFLNDPASWVESKLLRSPGKFDPLPGWLGESLPLAFYGTTFGMLALGLLGWRWTHARRQEGRLLALASIFPPLPYILSHAENLVGPRLPLDGVLLTYAAFALACVVPGAAFKLLHGHEVLEEEHTVARRLKEGLRHGVR